MTASPCSLRLQLWHTSRTFESFQAGLTLQSCVSVCVTCDWFPRRKRVELPCRKSWLWIVFLIPTDVWVFFVSTHWPKTHKGAFGRSVWRHARLPSRCGRDEAQMKRRWSRAGCRYENTWADQIRETLSRLSKGKNYYDERERTKLQLKTPMQLFI